VNRSDVLHGAGAAAGIARAGDAVSISENNPVLIVLKGRSTARLLGDRWRAEVDRGRPVRAAEERPIFQWLQQQRVDAMPAGPLGWAAGFGLVSKSNSRKARYMGPLLSRGMEEGVLGRCFSSE
jgi:hypothetical protein